MIGDKILADTSAWRDHLAKDNVFLKSVLRRGDAVTADIVLAELFMEDLADRKSTRELLLHTEKVSTPKFSDLFAIIEDHDLYAEAKITLNEALIAATAAVHQIGFFTFNKVQGQIAREMGVQKVYLWGEDQEPRPTRPLIVKL